MSLCKRKAAPNDITNDGDCVIDGLRFPHREREIDENGCEATKHALHFRGYDWDIPLTEQRDELTKNFVADAADACGLPADSIQNIRFAVHEEYLSVKCTVRHPTTVSMHVVQDQLAAHRWGRTKGMYQPRQQRERPVTHTGRQDWVATPQRQNSALGDWRPRRQMQNLSFFGRANVGPDGPEFEDGRDHDIEVYSVGEHGRNRDLLPTVTLVGAPQM